MAKKKRFKGGDDLCDLESLEAFFEVVAPGLHSLVARDDNQATMHLLESMFQHGAIALREHICPNMDFSVGIYSEDIRIECGVMNAA